MATDAGEAAGKWFFETFIQPLARRGMEFATRKTVQAIEDGLDKIVKWAINADEDTINRMGNNMFNQADIDKDGVVNPGEAQMFLEQPIQSEQDAFVVQEALQAAGFDTSIQVNHDKENNLTTYSIITKLDPADREEFHTALANAMNVAHTEAERRNELGYFEPMPEEQQQAYIDEYVKTYREEVPAELYEADAIEADSEIEAGFVEDPSNLERQLGAKEEDPDRARELDLEDELTTGAATPTDDLGGGAKAELLQDMKDKPRERIPLKDLVAECNAAAAADAAQTIERVGERIGEEVR